MNIKQYCNKDLCYFFILHDVGNAQSVLLFELESRLRVPRFEYTKQAVIMAYTCFENSDLFE